MKVATKLYCLVGALVALMIGIGMMGLKTAKDADDSLDTVYKDRVVPLKDLKVIADMYAVNIVDTSHKVRNGNLKWEDGRKNVADAAKTIDEKWKAYLATTLVEEEKKLVAETTPLKKVADDAVARLAGLMQKEDREGLTQLTISGLYETIDPVSGKFSELVDIQLKVAKEEFEKSAKEYHLARSISIALIVIGALLAGAFAFILIRSLATQLGGRAVVYR